jgi:alkylation response protein AidB-like acyl-CoA dehydrogenase
VDFAWSEEERTYRAELEAFLDAELPADWEEIAKGGPGSDAQVAFAKRFCPALARRGWLVQHWPAEHGGRDASPWRHAILGEELWARGEPRGPQYMNVNWIGPAIMKYGTDAQKTEHLPPIARGEAFWCQGFSEPEAGSDLVALRTLALRQPSGSSLRQPSGSSLRQPSGSSGGDGDVYVVNGSKIWTSYANHAGHCFLLVRTDPESKRHHGITVLLMPMDLPGVVVREIPSVVGDRYFHEVFLTDVRVPDACRLGPEGAGWEVVTYALQYERVGAARYARAARTLDALAARARAAGLLADPTVQEKLGAARATCEAARLLTYKVIDQRVHGLPPSADTNVARVAGTLAERAVSDLALELFGAEAAEYGSFADAHFRLAMTAGVAVGTTEVNLNLVASRVLGLPRE